MPRISFKSYVASLDAEKLAKLKYIEDPRFHYVYRITNIVEGKHYYGSRTSSVSPELDLGIEYFTSATSNSWIIEDQKNNKQNYSYKIIRSDFKTRADATIYESYLHSLFDVKNHEKFYNGSNQTPYGFDMTGVDGKVGVPKSEETKQKISMSKRGIPKSDEHKRKISERMKGKKHTPETISKIQKSNIGKKHTDETKQKLSEMKIGTLLSDETKKKISDSKIGNSFRLGMNHSDETRKKISMTQTGKKRGPYKKND